MKRRFLIFEPGQRFGRLTVIAKDAAKSGAWTVRCDCGTEKSVTGNNLDRGKTRSCGCLQREDLSRRMRKHGQSQAHSGEYHAWKHMKQRCYNPRGERWEHYGGRGIEVCPQWRDDFLAFLAYIGPRPSPEHSIDRIDNDGNYEPGNVRWATDQEQRLNKRKATECPNGHPYTPDNLVFRVENGLTVRRCKECRRERHRRWVRRQRAVS